MERQFSIAFQTDKSPREYIALAQLVNRYAFEVVSVYCDAPFHPSYGPLQLMAPYLEHARVGPAAVSPFRIHPIDIAAETALLAGLAKGGVYIGLARGAWLSDYGIQEPDQPVKAIGEAVAVINSLLGQNSGPASKEGKYFKLAGHVRAPYPLPAEKIPFLIGTWGRKLAALAGEIAEEVKVGGSTNPDFAPLMRSYIREGEVRAGRMPGSVRLVMGAVCVVDEDGKMARQKAKEAVALYLPVVAPFDPTVQVDGELLARIRTHLQQDENEMAARLVPDDILDRFAFSGSPAGLIDQCERLFAAGVERIEFGTPHGLDPRQGIRLLGEKVISYWKK
jgi:5,10-methylenetetrahydromethanopterin reductase